jgi:hypothetical protein
MGSENPDLAQDLRRRPRGIRVLRSLTNCVAEIRCEISRDLRGSSAARGSGPSAGRTAGGLVVLPSFIFRTDVGGMNSARTI